VRRSSSVVRPYLPVRDVAVLAAIAAAVTGDESLMEVVAVAGGRCLILGPYLVL
jgi:hypothetical protein